MGRSDQNIHICLCGKLYLLERYLQTCTAMICSRQNMGVKIYVHSFHLTFVCRWDSLRNTYIYRSGNTYYNGSCSALLPGCPGRSE